MSLPEKAGSIFRDKLRTVTLAEDVERKHVLLKHPTKLRGPVPRVSMVEQSR